MTIAVQCSQCGTGSAVLLDFVRLRGAPKGCRCSSEAKGVGSAANHRCLRSASKRVTTSFQLGYAPKHSRLHCSV